MQATYHEPGLVPSGMLAVGVHVAFFVLMFFGVNWQTRVNEPIMVDVWDDIPEFEAPPEPTPPPPPPKPMPKVDVTPPPPPPEPKVEEPKQADIQLKAQKEQERARKKEELLQKKEEKRRILEEKRRVEEERVAEKKRVEELARQIEEERKVEEEARKRDEAMFDQLAKKDEKRRKDEEAKRKRDADQAMARGKQLDEFIGKIKAKIQSKVNIPPGLAGNPEAHYSVTVLPGGDVLEIKLIKSSGVPAYDIAVERAIKASEPLPVPSQPELFQQMRILDLKFRPLE